MARRKRRQSDEAPGWVWMLFGLGIGLIIAFGVYMNLQPESSAAPAATVAAQPSAAEPVSEAPAPAAERAPAPKPDPVPEAAPAAQPESAGAADDDSMDFSFYDVLASFEVIIPEVESPAVRPEEVAEVSDPGVYVIQAGSFATRADAETQRARLALLGIETRVQRVSIDDRTFHRVRTGPIVDLGQLNSIRARLLAENIDSMVMRMTE